MDAGVSRDRRRFYLERGLRKRPVGSGSNLSRLMLLPRQALEMNFNEVFGEIPALAVGATAVRAYAPERSTQDIDFLVADSQFALAAARLVSTGFSKTRDLFFPNAGLGLYGASFTNERTELDLLSSRQPWCEAAFKDRCTDQTGLRVIPLPFLVLMKVDSARGVDQGDLTRMLGRLDEPAVEKIIAEIQPFYGDPALSDDLRQYALLGRWEWDSSN